MAHILDINIVSSKDGGDISYGRETTIDRIQQNIEAVMTEHIPRGQISTISMRVKKPAGTFRRYVRGQAGVHVTTIQIRIAPGGSQDMGRDEAIRASQQSIPALVRANVPADHLCSLVIAVKEPR